MDRRQPAAISPRKRAERLTALICSLALFGTLMGACSSRLLPAEAHGTATGVSLPVQGAAAGATAVQPIDGLATAEATTVAAPTPSANRSETADRPATATADVTRVHLAAAELAAKADALVRAAPAHAAVEIGLPGGSTLYTHNSEDLYDAASLYKLGIMVQVYKDRDDGILTFDDPVTLEPGFFYESDEVYSPDADLYADVPVAELLRNMITLSSNVAAEALLNLVGTDDVNETMADLGLVNTKILWSPVAARSPSGEAMMTWVDPGRSPALVPVIARSFRTPVPLVAESSADGAYDVTTAGDMAQLFEQLLAGSVLSSGTSAEMLNLLSEQQINNRLPADLPAGTKVAHKTGDLDGLLHDAGVIYAPAGPVVVVVMTDEITDNDAIIDLMHQIAVLAYEYTP